jgi:hypothetical protein
MTRGIATYGLWILDIIPARTYQNVFAGVIIVYETLAKP